MQASSETSIVMTESKDGMDNQMWMGDIILMNKAFPGKVNIKFLTILLINSKVYPLWIRSWTVKPGNMYSWPSMMFHKFSILKYGDGPLISRLLLLSKKEVGIVLMYSGMVKLEYGKMALLCLITKSSLGSCLENWENMTCVNFSFLGW